MLRVLFSIDVRSVPFAMSPFYLQLQTADRVLAELLIIIVGAVFPVFSIGNDHVFAEPIPPLLTGLKISIVNVDEFNRICIAITKK